VKHPERDVRFPDDGIFGRILRVTRHPLRGLAMALAATAVAAGVTTGGGVASAILGALGGVVVGEVLARSRVRLIAATLGFAGIGLVAFLIAWMCTGTETFAGMLGPSNALSTSAVLRWGFGVFALVGALRVGGARYPTAMGLELGVVVVAVAGLLAAHRDGVIARPLWISDWAWQKGIDPATVFLSLGATAAVILAVLLVLEVKSGRTVSTILSLPLLALLAVACLDVVGRPSPQAEDGLGLTTEEQGDPPNEMPDSPDGSTGPDGDGADAGGQSQGGEDGGAGGHGDAGVDASGGLVDGGSSQSGGLDGGGAEGTEDGGQSGAGEDAGVDASGAGGADAGDGGSAGGQDAGADGGASGAEDAGADAGAGATDAAMPDTGIPPPQDLNQQEQQQQQQQEQQQQQQQQQQQNQQQQDQPNQNPAPMAVVILYDDYSPPVQAYYFRQETWSEWNGSRLVASEVEGVDDDTLDAFPSRRTTVAEPPEEARVRIRGRVAMLVEHQHPFALESPVSFRPVNNPNPDRFVRAYEFESLAQATGYGELIGRGAGDPEWPDEVRELYLTPHPDERIAELSAQIFEESDIPPAMEDDPFARALATKLWLDRELIYSTRERHAGVEDPTIDFLFGNRIGYCVHFAHSAVFLYRAAGVPARVGTGYMVPEENRRGGSSILVRSADAHAWAEIYLEGVGWVVLDIAAERNLDEPSQPLDEDMQRMLGEMAREDSADPEDEIRDEEEEDAWELPVELWVLALILLGFALAVLYTIKLWRRLSPVFASKKALSRVAYRAHLDRLAEIGLSREYGETREAFAERVEKVAPSFAKMTRLHVAARLGNPQADPASREELDRGSWRELGRSVRREVRSTIKLWRRLLGLLHPVSFMDSR